jgi:hypothetical protein
VPSIYDSVKTGMFKKNKHEDAVFEEEGSINITP